MKQTEAIFRDLVQQHAGIIEKTARGFAHGDQRGDLRQEILLAIWRALPRFRGDAQLTTFIYRVCQNAALAWIRQQSRYDARHTQASDDAIAALTNPDASTKPIEERLLYQAIRKLPDFDRSLVLLYLDDLSYTQIAEITGITVNNVGARLTRARARLQNLVEESHE